MKKRQLTNQQKMQIVLEGMRGKTHAHYTQAKGRSTQSNLGYRYEQSNDCVFKRLHTTTVDELISTKGGTTTTKNLPYFGLT